MPRRELIAAAALVLLIAAAPAPRARFEPIAVLTEALPLSGDVANAWSPDGRWFAFQDPGALRLFDRRHPSRPPRTVLRLPTPTLYAVAWSRDGAWLATSTVTYGGLNDDGPRIREALWVVRADSGEAIRIETDPDARPAFWDAENFLYLRSGSERYRRIRPAPVPPAAPATRPGAEDFTWIENRSGARVRAGDPPLVTRLPRYLRQELHLVLPGGRRFLELRGPTETQPHRYEVVDSAGVPLPGLGGPLYWDSTGTNMGGFLAHASSPDGRYLLGELISEGENESGGASRVWMVELAGWKGGPIEGVGEGGEPCLSPDGRYLAFARSPRELHIGRLVPIP